MLSRVFPLSRKEKIVEQEFENEILIYDLNRHKALCLNEPSAIVWQLCDGKKSVADIGRIVEEKLKAPVTEDFVWLALDQLKKENLLVNGKSIERRFAGLSRREVVKKIGLASVIALPMISSIVAPSPVHAQSACTANGGTVMGTFPFDPNNDSNTCLMALIAQCCSMSGSGGCSCINPPTPNTCVGTITCGVAPTPISIPLPR